MENLESLAGKILNDTFDKARVINYSEEVIFRALIEANKRVKSYFAISPQASFSQFVNPHNKQNWHIYKSFSVDFLIWDTIDCIPLLVVEYHGKGHYGDNENKKKEVDLNDLIKATILAKANIRLEIVKDEEVSLKTTMEKNKKKGALWYKFCDIFEELQKELLQIRQKYKETEERNRAKNKKTK